VVQAEVRTLKSNERPGYGALEKMDVDHPRKGGKGKEVGGPSQVALGRKKAVELAKRALGGDSQVSLTVKELAAVSPMMAEELISVIKDSAGLRTEGNHVSFDVRAGEAGAKSEQRDPCPELESDAVSCPLGYVQMGIGDQQVWAMIDSGSMVNLLPADLARDADLVRRQAKIGLRGIGGHECQVEGVVESEWVEVAKCKKRVSFLVAKTPDVILGRPFLFAFQAALRYDATRREEILGVVDNRGSRYETTICQPTSGDWEPSERFGRGEGVTARTATREGPLGGGGF